MAASHHDVGSLARHRAATPRRGIGPRAAVEGVDRRATGRPLVGHALGLGRGIERLAGVAGVVGTARRSVVIVGARARSAVGTSVARARRPVGRAVATATRERREGERGHQPCRREAMPARGARIVPDHAQTRVHSRCHPRAPVRRARRARGRARKTGWQGAPAGLCGPRPPSHLRNCMGGTAIRGHENCDCERDAQPLCVRDRTGRPHGMWW